MRFFFLPRKKNDVFSSPGPGLPEELIGIVILPLSICPSVHPSVHRPSAPLASTAGWSQSFLIWSISLMGLR